MTKHKAKMVVMGVLLSAFVLCILGAQVSAKKTLIFGSWASWTDEGTPKQKFIQKFEQQYPDIQVESRVLPYNAYVEKLRVMVAAGDEPDLIHIDGSRYLELVLSQLMEPLEDHLTPVELDMIDPSYLDLARVNGKLYGFMTHENCDGLLVRPDFIEEAGWELGAIKTWDDFIQLAKDLTKDTDGDGTMDQFGFIVMGGAAVGFGINSDLIFKSNGITAIDLDKKDAYLEVLNLFSTLGPYMPPEFNTARGGPKRRMWGSGRLAMNIHGNWWANDMMGVNPDVVMPGKLAVIPFPQGPSQVTGQEVYWNREWLGLLAFKDSENLAEAIEMIKFMTLKKENSLPLMTTTLSPLRGVTADEITDYLRWGKRFDFWVQNWFDLAANYPSSKTSAFTNNEEWVQLYVAEYIKLAGGKQSAQEAYNAIRKIYDRVEPEKMID